MSAEKSSIFLKATVHTIYEFTTIANVERIEISRFFKREKNREKNM